jgi:uncharacterized protein (TIGR00299 family) protein
MILGALVALGVDSDELRRRLELLEIPGFTLKFEKVDRCGISSIHARVNTSETAIHRHLSDIRQIIEGSQLSDSVKLRSMAIFQRLAEAEASVHGIPPESVHFHEVGALDAIVDIVGACIGFDLLGVEEFVSSPINVGSGFVEMAHGRYPVPPPAVAELLQGTPFYASDAGVELTTPTGAAIVTTFATRYEPIPHMTLEATGYGAGTRDFNGPPNVLRLLLGETAAERGTLPQVTLIEANIDDASPQVLGHVLDRALELGARDCWFTPIQMKKNRPAVMLSVLCDQEIRESLTRMIFEETTTIGLRVQEVEREILEREIHRVDTRFGAIDMKIAMLDGREINALPEYEQARELAVRSGVPLRAVTDAALAAWNSKARAAGN